MRRLLRAAITLSAVSVSLTACSDRPVSEPSGPTLPRSLGANAVQLLPACDITALKNAVRSYVASGSDPIYVTIRNLQQTSDPDLRYAYGMDGLARLALVRASVDPVLKKVGATAVQGGAAFTAFLPCMGITQVQNDFTTNIGNAFDVGGMVEVPTVSSSGAIFSRGKTPFWYAKPKTGTWGELLNKRIAVFGYEIPDIPGNTDPKVGAKGFDFNSLPMLVNDQRFNNYLLFGACGLTEAGANARFKHVNSIKVNETIACPATAPVMASASWNGALNFASFVHATFSFFTPRPLNAAAVGGVGGGADNFMSPTAIVTVDDTLSFTSQPVGGFISEPLKGTDGVSVKVLVKTKAGTPIEHAIVTLTITGNSGLNALFFDPTLPLPGTSYQVIRETTSDGIADFNGIRMIKAGGYTVTASGNFDGIGATPIVSGPSPFNMQNK